MVCTGPWCPGQRTTCIQRLIYTAAKSASSPILRLTLCNHVRCGRPCWRLNIPHCERSAVPLHYYLKLSNKSAQIHRMHVLVQDWGPVQGKRKRTTVALQLVAGLVVVQVRVHVFAAHHKAAPLGAEADALHLPVLAEGLSLLQLLPIPEPRLHIKRTRCERHKDAPFR